jgi:hypothetical protein
MLKGGRRIPGAHRDRRALHDKATYRRAATSRNSSRGSGSSWAAGYPIADSSRVSRVYPPELLCEAHALRMSRGPVRVVKQTCSPRWARGVRSGAVSDYRASTPPALRPSTFRPVVDFARIPSRWSVAVYAARNDPVWGLCAA